MPYRGISCKDERVANEIENFDALFAVRMMYDDGRAQEGGEMFYYFPGSCYFFPPLSLSLSLSLSLAPLLLFRLLIFYSISSIQYRAANKGIQLRAIMKMCNNNDIINVINLVRIKFDLYYGQWYSMHWIFRDSITITNAGCTRRPPRKKLV